MVPSSKLGLLGSSFGVACLSCKTPFRWLPSRQSCAKLFVGGICYDTNEMVLKDTFGQYGEILEVKVICDHVTGKSKGYGFVRFVSKDSASRAFEEMDGQVLEGRNLRVSYAYKE